VSATRRSSGTRWQARVVVWCVAVGVALAGTACAGGEQYGSLAARVWTWATTTGVGQAVGTLQGDTARIDAALGAHAAPSVIRTLCAGLTVDAANAASNLPTPDPQLTTTLDAAYHAAAAAAADCYQGAGGDAALLARSAAERVRADAQLSAAVQRMSQLTGKVVPTTTTTQPGGSSGDVFGF